MASKSYGVNHGLAVKAWARRLHVEALKRTSFANLQSNRPYSLVHRKDELAKARGDQVTFGLRMQMTGEGRQGSEVLEGHEEALTTFEDAIIINLLRHAARSESSNSISQQRVPFNIRDEMLDAIADWWADTFDTALFNQLCGYTAETRTKRTGNQATVAPDTGHVIRQTSRANDESLVAGDEFTLSMVDKAKELAATATPAIRPADLGGGLKMHVCFLHEYQVTDLRTDAATAGNWFDIQQAAMQGGDVSKNPIFTGALGVYNNTLLLANNRVTNGVHSSTAASVAAARRAVFCGAQAACLAFGQDNSGPNNLTWVEKLFDYDNQLGVAANSIFGLKKTRFNSQDFGVVTLPTYAVAHT